MKTLVVRKSVGNVPPGCVELIGRNGRYLILGFTMRGGTGGR